jgi:hypothetical protein
MQSERQVRITRDAWERQAADYARRGDRALWLSTCAVVSSLDSVLQDDAVKGWKHPMDRIPFPAVAAGAR